ncbi:MAG TPA: DUF4126 domain-containing protein [Gemmatimonadota bacterium]|nr:DUF4126 domain-containing protein [Gemmatimonadota bacterium]
MELALALGRSVGFAVGAGINLYATVLVAGLAARFGWVDLPPAFEVLGSGWVIGGAAALYLIEFVADKVPWVDTAWDTLHTIVRPLGAAGLAVLALGPSEAGVQVVAGLLGGAVGASTHAAKAGTRVAVNASPEPASNVIVSLAEDGFVVGLVVLLLTHPWLGIAAALLALAAVLAVLLLLARAVRRRRPRAHS